MKANFFDELEIRTLEERDEYNFKKLIKLINIAKQIPYHKNRLEKKITNLNDLQKIDVFRKSDLIKLQKKNFPFGNLNFSKINEFSHIYRSPGPIYDLDGHGHNWWRFAKT